MNLEQHLMQVKNSHNQSFCTLTRLLYDLESEFVQLQDIKLVGAIFTGYGFLDIALIQMLHMEHLIPERDEINFLREILDYNCVSINLLVIGHLNEVAIAEIEKQDETVN